MLALESEQKELQFLRSLEHRKKYDGSISMKDNELKQTIDNSQSLVRSVD